MQPHAPDNPTPAAAGDVNEAATAQGGAEVYRRVLVTGANRGIGLASVRRLLTAASDTFVYLGTRDQGRGDTAALGLISENAAWQERLEVLVIDPTSHASVACAAARLGAAGVTLYGIVNNAGGFMSFVDMLDLHLYGVKRVNDALTPLLQVGGRIINVSSGGAPACVAKCRADRKALLSRTNLDWEDIDGLAREVSDAVAQMGGDDTVTTTNESDAAILASTGVAWGLRGYGFSKALLNCYTSYLQRQQPHILVNACNPGFIETDLTRRYAAEVGKTLAELGMRPVQEGALAVCRLVLGGEDTVVGRGAYYESDGTPRGFAEVDPGDLEA